MNPSPPQKKLASKSPAILGLSSNDGKRIESIELIEIYAHGTSKDLVCKKEKIKCNNLGLDKFAMIN